MEVPVNPIVINTIFTESMLKPEIFSMKKNYNRLEF